MEFHILKVCVMRKNWMIKKYRIKCYYKDYGHQTRMVYMPQVKRFFWWVDLSQSDSFWNSITKTKENATSLIQDIKDTEAKKAAPATYIDVE